MKTRVMHGTDFLTNLGENHARIIPVRIHQNPTVGLLKEFDFENGLQTDGRRMDDMPSHKLIWPLASKDKNEDFGEHL